MQYEVNCTCKSCEILRRAFESQGKPANLCCHTSWQSRERETVQVCPPPPPPPRTTSLTTFSVLTVSSFPGKQCWLCYLLFTSIDSVTRLLLVLTLLSLPTKELPELTLLFLSTSVDCITLHLLVLTLLTSSSQSWLWCRSIPVLTVTPYIYWCRVDSVVAQYQCWLYHLTFAGVDSVNKQLPDLTLLSLSTCVDCVTLHLLVLTLLPNSYQCWLFLRHVYISVDSFTKLLPVLTLVIASHKTVSSVVSVVPPYQTVLTVFNTLHLLVLTLLPNSHQR